jgi:hypothetical protein
MHLLIAAVLLALASPSRAASSGVAYQCDFAKGLQGWAPNATAAVKQAPDGIVVTTDGRDPQLLSPRLDIEPREGDALEVRMAASRTGDIQWFWATDTGGAFGGLSQEQSRHATTKAGAVFATISARAFWSTQKHIVRLRFDLPEGMPGVYRVASIRIVRGSASIPLVWRGEYRLPISPKRIDVATTAPPTTKPVSSDYTVAMWYFAAWEPEYTWDGWQQIAERSPWRVPLLYDSSDTEERFSGIQFYRSSNRRVIDWHVHWMREHAVNLMIWDWYPGAKSDGSFDPTSFTNRALEVGFLGKDKLGDPPVTSNRFAEIMPFAIMWTNHPPMNALPNGLAEYIVDQFLLQPNYYRIDGKPLLPLWSPGQLVSTAGGEAKAHAVLDHLRAYARSKGLPGVYIVAVNEVNSREQAQRIGLDGAMGYNLLLTGGATSEYRRVGERVIEDRIEDFATQTTPGHEVSWRHMTGAFGRDYLLPTTPMQNWEPTLRPTSYVIRGNTPDLYRDMLHRAKTFIEQRHMRKFVTIEAWNEWLEGSYVEPSTQWGLSYLEAIRDVFRK